MQEGLGTLPETQVGSDLWSIHADPAIIHPHFSFQSHYCGLCLKIRGHQWWLIRWIALIMSWNWPDYNHVNLLCVPCSGQNTVILVSIGWSYPHSILVGRVVYLLVEVKPGPLCSYRCDQLLIKIVNAIMHLLLVFENYLIFFVYSPVMHLTWNMSMMTLMIILLKYQVGVCELHFKRWRL